VSFPNPDVQLSDELRESKAEPVLSYMTTDPRPQYFQLYVLDNLTDSGWNLFSKPKSLVNANPELPTPPGLTSAGTGYAPQVTTQVKLSKDVGQDQLAALPVPYPATSISVGGNVQAEQNSLMVFENGKPLAGLPYTVSSLDESRMPASVLNQAKAAPADITSHYLNVPSSYDSLRHLLNSVLATAKAKTPIQKAIALQEWLAGGEFTYTTKAQSIVNAQGLEKFLETSKKGYCQQFAFAMAVLARMAGIPSRVAYGFTAGTQQNGDVWLVTTHDAHAWPELYFQGAGWLRFEPTPGGQTGQGTATSPDYTQQPVNPFVPTNPATTGPQPGPSASAGAGAGSATLPRNILPPNLLHSGDGGAFPQDTVSPLEIFLLALVSLAGLLLLVSAAPAVARLLIRRRRWHRGVRGADAGLAHTAWRELRDDLVDYRAGYLPSESPRALAARVGEALELPEPALASLRRITMAEERARYAARPDLGVGLRQDSAVLRHAIAAAAPRRTRWLARLLPSSVIAPAMLRVIAVADFSSGRLTPGWFGRTRLGGSMLGRAGFGRAGFGREAGADTGAGASGGESAVRREPPVSAGARRD
jgi:transglutaminase-like putative cysteine protease